MKIQSPSTSTRLLAGALLAGFTALPVTADVLVDWNQQWRFFHPMGTFPTPAGNFNTTWFKPDLVAAGYTGPAVWTGATTGVPGAAANDSYDSGLGAGPIGYGAVDFFTANTLTLVDTTTIGAITTALSTPVNTARYTAYFRTTFTVPAGGLSNPTLDYILDDGGLVYLDGDLVLRVNTASDTDTYTALAANTTSTEAWVRRAELSLTVGTTTGAQFQPAGAGVGNAVVRKSTGRLSAGTHTLAVAVRNQAVGSSDVCLIARLSATPGCFISPSLVSTNRVDTNATPFEADDDVVSAVVNVAVFNQPVGSTGFKIGASPTILPYGTNQTITVGTLGSVPAPITVTLVDSADAACTATLTVQPPRIIGLDDVTPAAFPGSPSIIITQTAPVTTPFVYDNTALDLVDGPGNLLEPNFTTGGAQVAPFTVGGWRFLEGIGNHVLIDGTSVSAGNAGIVSKPIPLSGAGLKKFSLEFTYYDTSTGSNYDADDSVSANLLVATPSGTKTIELLGPWDRNGNGVINGAGGQGATTTNPDDETNRTLALGGDYYKADILASRVLPPGATSVQLVIGGGTNSGSEHFRFQKIKLEPYAGVYDADADGLPDDWELAYLGSTASGAGDDPDSDGNSNIAEFKGSTHPGESGAGVAVNSVAIDFLAGSAVVDFRTHPGTNYKVEVSTDLAAWGTAVGYVTSTGGPAAALSSVTATGTALNFTLTIPPGTLRAFARLTPL